jgi:hypothetical protein
VRVPLRFIELFSKTVGNNSNVCLLFVEYLDSISNIRRKEKIHLFVYSVRTVADHDQKIWGLKFLKQVGSQLFNITANKLLVRSKRIEMGARIYTIIEIRLVTK